MAIRQPLMTSSAHQPPSDSSCNLTCRLQGLESDLITARGQVAQQQEVICSLQHQLAVSQHHLQQQQQMARMFVPESGVTSGRHARDLEQAGRAPGGALTVRLYGLCRGGCHTWRDRSSCCALCMCEMAAWHSLK